MSSITLREATDADVAALVTLLIAAFEEYRGRLDPPSGAHDETEEQLRGTLRGAHAVLARAAGDLVGCVFYASMGDYVDLFRLAVLPAYRRRGVGRALIEYVEGRALALGIPRVQLGVRAALPGNRAYYERMGYRFLEARAHTGYAEPTYVILEKQLTRRPDDTMTR
jgi:ribosomal protein S18 acetylase RimI-like enzyme